MIKVNNKIDVIAIDGDAKTRIGEPRTVMSVGSCNVDDLMYGIFVDISFTDGTHSSAVYTVKAEDLIAAVQNATRLGMRP